jgi:UDP-N-acetylglucosamine 2-epimerase (non-hydrolysing)
MQPKIIHLIAGARPNFMKIAPIWHVLNAMQWCNVKIVHTGQHHDLNMSDWFFQDLGLPAPDFNLEATTGSHARVTGSIMISYEELIKIHRPDLTVVVGDVDSTIACTLSAKKMGVPVAHLEAGLRSFDRTMPEELNRLLVDSIADLLWTPSPDGDENLLKEGVDPMRIQRVGNIMIDSLVRVGDKIAAVDLHQKIGVDVTQPYCVVTTHRPSNVDHKDQLEQIVDHLVQISEKIQVIFPIHPRTRKKLIDFGLIDRITDTTIRSLEPLGYIDFNALVRSCTFLLTDSGGVQEETTFMGVPCLTLRPNTERPITITQGTNKLVTLNSLQDDVDVILKDTQRCPSKIDLWDGKTAERIEVKLREYLNV